MAPFGSLAPGRDTGQNIPESHETLQAQQKQLIDGRKAAQMFPMNSSELPLPSGMHRIVTPRGIFHFNPSKVSRHHVARLSAAGRENELLGMGPYSKSDIANRMHAGEPMVAVTERSPDGTEVKAAAGTPSTAQSQISAFHKSKTPGNVIGIESVAGVLSNRKSAAMRKAY
jgi:hypothetical protein